MTKKKDKKKEQRISPPIRKKPFQPGEFFKTHRPVLGLIFLGTLLRFADLGRQSLWIDEMLCWSDSHATYEQIFRKVHETVYLLQKVSCALGGDHEYFLRLPSALGGLIGLIFIYPLTLLLSDNRKAALYALILLVFSPINIYYSQDANYYGLMMGFAILSLYLLFLFMKTYHPVWLILFGIISYINYHVHPSNILLTACQLVSLGIFLVFDPGFRNACRFLFEKLTRNKLAFVSASLVSLILLGYLGRKFLLHVYRMTFSSYGETISENLSLTPDFFKKLAMDYSVAFQQYSSYVLILTLFFLVLFFVGLIYSLKKQRYFAFFVVCSWTLPFLAMYMKKIGHFYHCRYTSFIVPGFLILAALGMERIRVFVELKKNSLWARTAVTICFGVIALGMVPNLFRYYTGEKQDWKDAVRYLQKNLKSGEQVTTNIFCNDSSLRFYYSYFGMDPTPLVKLAGEFRGAPYTGLFRLKKLCFTTPGVYFATSYTRYEDPSLWDWAKSCFDQVFYVPSLHPEEFNREGKEVILYKFKYSGSFVFPPYHYSFLPQYPLPLSRGFEKQLLFGAKGDFRIGLECKNVNNPQSFHIQAKDQAGQVVSEKLKIEQEGDKYILSAVLALNEGLYTLSLSGPTEQIPEATLSSLYVLPEIGGIYHREAEDTDLYHPSPWKRIEEIGGARCFTVERNNYIYYDRVPFSKTGRYSLTLRALEDSPGPVTIEVSLDWKPQGFLIFDKGDNTWSEKSFSLHAPEGEHTLSFHFLASPEEVNKTLRGQVSSERNQDTDMCLDYFEIKNLAPGGKFPDMRLSIPQKVIAPITAIEEGFENPQSPGTLAPKWQLTPQHKFSFNEVKDPEFSKAIRITVPPNSQALNLLTPGFFVKPGTILYFSARLRVENLQNHSANMMVLYLDEKGNIVGKDIVNSDGITDTTDWIRQVYFQPVHPRAVAAIISFWVYLNSVHTSPEDGYVYFNPVRFETLHEPETN